MNSNNQPAFDLRERYCMLFENNITCSNCGNDNWEAFMYVAAGSRIAAACTRWGTPFFTTETEALVRKTRR